MLENPVLVRVVHGDVLEFEADVLILKYARNLHGADGAVYQQFMRARKMFTLPQEGDHLFVQSDGILSSRNVLFVGVAALSHFGYLGIREFARQALTILANEKNVKAAHVAITLHGVGYGLDEQEAFESEVAGFVDALVHTGALQLKTISIVERDKTRVERLSNLLQELLPPGAIGWRALSPIQIPPSAALRTAGRASADKQHVFVAMPFIESMNDIFHYGIESTVKAAGMLCERADLSVYAGDIMIWVKQRIETAHLIVADLTTANPNVYLEVGYAWGRGIPTVLLSGNPADLKFDVRGHRCLIYKNIQHLEEMLTQELKALSKN